MRPKTPSMIALAMLMLLATAEVRADTVDRKTYTGTYPIDDGGVLSIVNPQGRILLHAVEGDTVRTRATLHVQGVNDQSVQEGLARVSVRTGGNRSRRYFRSAGPASGVGDGWSAMVVFEIWAPPSVQINIESFNSELIQLVGFTGHAWIKAFNGPVVIRTPGAPVVVDTINGDILFQVSKNLRDAKLSSMNGRIRAHIPGGAGFHWIADTVQGEINGPLQWTAARVSQENGITVVRYDEGSGERPTIHTSSMKGAILLTKSGVSLRDTGSLIAQQTPSGGYQRADQDVLAELRSLLLQPPSAQTFVFQRRRVLETLEFRTDLGNVSVAEVRGDASIFTGAGEINVGKVVGRCTVETEGGPINIGEVWGPLKAHTKAGDVTIRAALAGGVATTNAGNVHVGTATGGLELRSGGGDITVDHLKSGLRARANSGDIIISIDIDARDVSLDASTVGGNIILYVPRGFDASWDLAVHTSQDESHGISSDVPGLTFVRDRLASHTRILANRRRTDTSNHILLRADEGNIQIRTR